MFKKSLLTVALIATAVVMAGCANKAEDENAPEKIDYIVTVELPTEAASYVKDKADKDYVKIAPHFYADKVPAGKSKIKWFKTGLGSKIPAFPEGKLLEVINTDKDFVAYIGNVDAKMFQAYFEKLAANGYQFYEDMSWESLSMYNDKYEVNLRFSQDGSNITVVRARILRPDEAAKAAKVIGAITKKANEEGQAKLDTQAKDAGKADVKAEDKAKTEAAKEEKPAEDKAKETKK